MPFDHFLLGAVLALPWAAAGLLAAGTWLGFRQRERTISTVIGVAFGGATLAGIVLTITMLVRGSRSVTLPLGSWFVVDHYRFDWTLVGDRLSLPFALFSTVLVGLIAAFSSRYLHREAGFHRFYLLLALFGASVNLVVLAGNLDLLFFGWEIVGLTSALLIAFFHERQRPVENGLRAFLTYRFCDVGLLAAAVWLHHTVGTSSIAAGATDLPWAGLVLPREAQNVLIVGLLLLWASMGKSAQVPFGGWLPRAMEGPTTSSAIFYGAVSIHLGPYLLLRAAPILDASPIAATCVVCVGALTAMHGTFVGRVQTDIKSALAYASMTQVGLIFVEIGFGLRYFALAHILGHAALRGLQILRSPNLLHDRHHLEQAMGQVMSRTGGHLERLVPRSLQPWLYLQAIERGSFDSLLKDHVVGGFVLVVRGIERIEKAWVRLLCGANEEAP